MMKVLILGGTGAMGKHLVHLLAKEGFEVYVTSRKEISSEENIVYVKGNAHNLEFIQLLLGTHWDAVVDFMVYSTIEFKKRIDIILLATTQYIFISSARVYADSKEPIVETSPRLLELCKDKTYLKTDEYALSKARQEDILKNSGRVNWTIIRPYITYSENRLQLGVFEKEEWLYRALHGRSIVFSQDIASKNTVLTSGLDVAKGIASIIGNEKTFGETFNITNNQPIAWEEVLTIYLEVLEKHLGYKPKVLLCDLESFVKTHPRKYQIKYDRLFNRQFKNNRIATYIDVNSFVTPPKGLSDCLNTFMKEMQFKNINWKTEAIKDRKTREFTPFNEIIGVKQKAKYIFYRFIKIKNR